MKRQNHHHLVPKQRGGGDTPQNLLYIDIRIHQRWHMVFGNRTLKEVIQLLKRVQRAKAHQRAR